MVTLDLVSATGSVPESQLPYDRHPKVPWLSTFAQVGLGGSKCWLPLDPLLLEASPSGSFLRAHFLELSFLERK